MAAKKNLGRFSICLNIDDPDHRKVAALLNEQGRRKAQFIVNAVLHYTHTESPGSVLHALTEKDVEKIALRIFKQQFQVEKAPSLQLTSETLTSTGHVSNETNSELDEAELTSINNAMAAFRKR